MNGYMHSEVKISDYTPSQITINIREFKELV